MEASRAPSRISMPDLDLMLEESNRLLTSRGLPPCRSLEPMADGDTANPTAVLLSPQARYVVKVVASVA